jgi:hypothetical protein
MGYGFDVDFTDLGDKGICWTNTPYSKSALEQIPYIEMFGYQQDWSAAITSIQTWLTRFKIYGEGGNPYEALYMGKEATKYKLPYLNEFHHNTSQNWQENQGPLGAGVKQLTDLAETVGKAVLPAAGILYPKSYAGAGPTSFSFTFNLINTNASNGSIESNVTKNQKFLHQFVRDNLHDQNGVMSIIPPLIYEVYIPGVRWSPAAVVSGFTVNNKGSLNVNKGQMIIPGIGMKENYIFPDAWEVTISITELINESRRIWDDAIKDNASIGGGDIKTRAITTKFL